MTRTLLVIVQGLQIAICIFLIGFDILYGVYTTGLISAGTAAFAALGIAGAYTYNTYLLLAYGVYNVLWTGGSLFFVLLYAKAFALPNPPYASAFASPVPYAVPAARYFAATFAGDKDVSTQTGIMDGVTIGFSALHLTLAVCGTIQSLLLRSKYIKEDDMFEQYDGFDYF